MSFIRSDVFIRRLERDYSKRDSSYLMRGFTLVELLVYVSIFALSATFFVAILTAVTGVQVRQGSETEVNHQVSFVTNTIQRLVRESSLVDIPSGLVTNTLVLRVVEDNLDPTYVYVSDSRIYLKEGDNPEVSLTDARVLVDRFSVKRVDDEGGSVVYIDLTMSYNTTNDKSRFTRTARSAVVRVSAATFDSNIVPGSVGLDVGDLANNWQDGYFSGGLGIGVPPSLSAGLLTSGDVAFFSDSVGVVFKASGGCYRLNLNANLNLVTSTVACP